jgi:hypothetical protein
MEARLHANKAEVLMLRHLNKYWYGAIAGTLLLAMGITFAATRKASQPDPVILPESSAIHVTLNNAVASNESRPGDHFEATVSEPVVVDGKTVIPEGAQAEGLIVDVHPSGRLMGRAGLRLALESVDVNGNDYDIRTASDVRIGRNHNWRNLVLIGGGGGGGLLIGALAAGGKGALIGGPIGAGAGLAVAMLTGKKDIRLPAETPLTFRLARPATIDVKT